MVHGGASAPQDRPRDVRPAAERQAGRIPPHDLDAEAAVLSAIILDAATSLDVVAELLEPAHFYADAHRLIFEACLAVRQAQVGIDLVSIAGWLRDRQQIQRVGGVKYLAELVDATPAIAHVADHARRVVDLARLRQSIAASHEFAAQGYGDVGDLQEHLDRGAAQLATIAERADIDHATLGDGANRYLNDAATAALSTGIRALDEALGEVGSPGGLRLKSVYIVGSPRTGGAKTALACAMAHAIARQHDPDGELRSGVLYVTMEPAVSRDEIAIRLACPVGVVDFRRAMESRATMTQDEHTRLLSALAGNAGHPWLTDDRKKLHVGKVRASALRARQRFADCGQRLALVVVDYLQLLQPPPGTPPRQLGPKIIENDMESLVYLADDMQCPVVVVAALNGEGEVRYAPNAAAPVQAKIHVKLGKPKPTDPPHLVPCSFDLGKRRHGNPLGSATAWFEGRYQRFVEDG